MISGIAVLVFIPLLAISMLHFMWAFGSNWPAKDQKTLARTVAGFRGVKKMPPRIASFGVAVLIFVAGLWALAMSDPTPNRTLSIGGALLSLVFLGRGGVGFTKWWRAKTPEEPFATLDRKTYSPLCCGIGLGFLCLTIWRLV